MIICRVKFFKVCNLQFLFYFCQKIKLVDIHLAEKATQKFVTTCARRALKNKIPIQSKSYTSGEFKNIGKLMGFTTKSKERCTIPNSAPAFFGTTLSELLSLRATSSRSPHIEIYCSLSTSFRTHFFGLAMNIERSKRAAIAS